MDESNHQLEQATVLLLACARGDAKAFQRLYRLEAPRMLALARRLSGDRELAEEALQDTFVQVWRNAVRFHPEKGSARAWLYALLRYRLTRATSPLALQTRAATPSARRSGPMGPHPSLPGEPTLSAPSPTPSRAGPAAGGH